MSKSRPLERLLAIFSKVQPGEGVAVIILLVDLFFLLTSYYLLKVVREPLILASGGAVIKSYSSALQALMLLFLVPAYGLLGSKVSRKVLINTVTIIFMGSFVLFFVLHQAHAPIGIPFFLWLGIFNILIISQFWSLANELFSPEQGKRLFAIIAFGGTLGAIIGARIAGVMIKSLGIGSCLIGAAALLGVTIFLTMAGAAAARRGPRGSDPAGKVVPHQDKPLGKEGGFKLVAKTKYLRLLAALVLVLNVGNTMGEFLLGSHVAQDASAQVEKEVREHASTAPMTKEQIKDRKEALIGAFYSNFYFWVNLVAAILQAFVVSRVARFLGLRVGLVLVAVFSIGGYAAMAIFPVLMVARLAKISENSLDYSMQNTLQQMLWLPTTPTQKYKAKNAIETFFVRFGDMISAGVVWCGVQLALSMRMFALVTVFIGIVWVIVAVLLGRENDRLTAEAERAAATGADPDAEGRQPLPQAKLVERTT